MRTYKYKRYSYNRYGEYDFVDSGFVTIGNDNLPIVTEGCNRELTNIMLNTAKNHYDEYISALNGEMEVVEDALGYTYKVPKAFYIPPCGDKIVFQRYGKR